MTISTYPVHTGVEGYSKQSKVRLKPPASAESGRVDRFVDVVTLSRNNGMNVEITAKNAYTREDLLSPKKSESAPPQSSPVSRPAAANQG
jgi:hypothetical protein